MFPFDHSQLPKVFSRKAFIGVHFQNDFTSESGSLAATEPKGYVDRAMKLAAAFRACGNPVIWTKASLPATPVPSDDRITATDSVSAIPGRGRRRAPGAEASSNSPPDEEAFLSHDEASCLKPDSSGSELAPEIASEGSSDIVITNTDYSAFTGTALLRLLRSKMVMEVFICGSLVNIGVHATAIEAAGHGMAITIVEDCCGYRNHGRQTISLSRLSHLTGCDMVSAKEVCGSLKPSTRSSAPTLGPTPIDKRAAGRSHNVEDKSRSQSDQPSDLSDQLSKLQLEPDDSKLEPRDTKTKVPVKSPTSKQTAKSQNEAVLARPNGQTTSSASNDHASGSISNGDTQAEENIKERPTNGDKEIDHSAVIEVDDGVAGDVPTELWEAQRGLCAGDTDVIDNVLPPELVDGIFEKLRNEVSWQRMSHQGGEVPRLVAVQGEVEEDGSMPVYRHPSDESPPLLPFTPTVRAIKAETEKHLGHELNHVLIQFYRDGNDYISEHSDKTIDVVKKSYIANVSLGAQRTMVLRTKRQDKQSSKSHVDQSAAVDEVKQSEELKSASTPETPSTNINAEGGPLTEAKEAAKSQTQKTPKSRSTGQNAAPSSKREVQRATLRHNSLCRMGLNTNMQWLHSIRQDKRAERDKSDAELAFGGGRISLTFRRIGTFLNRDETKIWGQGATGKTKAEAKAVINGESPEMVAMLKAFGKENHSSSFDWEEYYGKGFDVLHMSNAPRLFASRDTLINMRVALMLAEYGIGYAKGSMTASRTCNLDEDQLEAASIKFVDSDASKSIVQGDMAIMLYLHECYGTVKEATASKPDMAKQFTHFQKALTVLARWRRVQLSAPGKVPDLKLLKEELTFWDKLAATAASSKDEETKFLSGSASRKPGLVDFALWPVLNDIVKTCGKDSLDGYADLEKWFKGFAGRDAVKSMAATPGSK